ncbi:MAG: hypothetical protein HY781_05595 [Chloroflexi bacterium]|nr:hypothetical protein [Chloroflexota bacterium]
MTKKNWKIFYPLLLGIYSAVGLVSANISQMTFLTGIRSILVAMLFSLAVYAAFCWRVKDEYKAALLCAVFMVFFFAYGHVYDSVEGIKIFGITAGRHRFLFPLWFAVFAFGGWLVYKRSWKLGSLSRILNITSIVLLAIPVIQIGLFEWQRYRSASGLDSESSASNMPENIVLSEGYMPDIYYIILDGYPRQDALLQYHNFDNSDFIEQLEAFGFYVPSCSQSNYAMTQLSLASSLNMEYVTQPGENVTANDLNGKIANSEIRRFLESLGYETVSVESGIWFTEFRDADYFISQDRPVASSFFDFTRFSEFEVVYARTSVLLLLEEAKAGWLDSLFQDHRKQLYERILFEFDQLELTPAIPSPKFVFAHILAPHTTEAIMNTAGEFELFTSVDPALGNEISYLNKRMLEVIQAILTESENPPIIIIQSDHGIDTEVRMANLIAYYLPLEGSDALYPTITPVNNFRLVLDIYFGQDYPLLPDVSYYSPYNEMFSFTQVQYPCMP